MFAKEKATYLLKVVSGLFACDSGGISSAPLLDSSDSILFN